MVTRSEMLKSLGMSCFSSKAVARHQMAIWSHLLMAYMGGIFSNETDSDINITLSLSGFYTIP